MEFNYQLQAIPRGNQAVVEVVLTDHTNTSVAEFLGSYTLFLNETEEWNVTDPDLPRLDVAFTPPWETFAGDYSWVLNYSGSTWLQPASVTDVIRIQGRANATVQLGLDWTPRGSTNWISGTANDIFHDTPITGNNSSVVVQLLVPSDLPSAPDGLPAPPVVHRLASGWINETTG